MLSVTFCHLPKKYNMDEELFNLFDLLAAVVNSSKKFNTNEINLNLDTNIFEVKIFNNDVPKDGRTKPIE